MQWLRVDAALPESPDLLAFGEALGVNEHVALSLVMRLYCWVARTREDGNLGKISAAGLCRVAQLTGKPAERIVAALLEAGQLERDETGGLRVHGWERIQAPMIAARDRQREFRQRQREFRAKRRELDLAEEERNAGIAAGGDASVTADAAPTVTPNATRNVARNVTRHATRDANQTRPDQTRPDLEKSIPPTRPASMREAKADGAGAPRRRDAPQPPGFVDFAALSDRELAELRLKAGKLAESDDRERRRYYAASHELARRSGKEPPFPAAEGPAEPRDEADPPDEPDDDLDGLTEARSGQIRAAAEGA